MSISWLIVCAALSAPGTSPAEQPTPLYVLSRETSAKLRQEAVARQPAERAAAVRELCELHRTLRNDARYDQIDKLQNLRGRVYSRLRRVQLRLKNEITRDAASGIESDRRGEEALTAAAKADETDQAALAASDSLASSLMLLDVATGGPHGLVARGGRAVPADHGPALVDLIERTINPAFWDTNGGPGTIVYYQPLMCLVVRASGEVHHRLGGLLGGLR